jgi:hypothetical protein
MSCSGCIVACAPDGSFVAEGKRWPMQDDAVLQHKPRFLWHELVTARQIIEIRTEDL